MTCGFGMCNYGVRLVLGGVGVVDFVPDTGFSRSVSARSEWRGAMRGSYEADERHA